MKKIIIILVLVLTVLATNKADASSYAGALTIVRIRVISGICYFGVTTPPLNTCSNWTDNFRFSMADANGKTMFNMISLAKLSSKKIEVWYIPSTAPGRDQSGGCTEAAMAIPFGIGFN